MNMRDVYQYYSRDDVKQALLEASKSREIVGVFRNGVFGTRPNTLIYPQDILAMVKTGVIEFHSSVERWSNPMALKLDNYESMRIGWDLILDLDCKHFDHGKIAAQVFIQTLKKYQITPSIKYTGNKGFHIGIPWECLPKEINYQQTVSLFPSLARNIVKYLKTQMEEDLEKALLKKFSVEELAEKSGKKLGTIFWNDKVRPFEIVDVDSILLSPRHMYRMPYSLNEKTFLVSLPLKIDDLEGFKKEHAKPDRIKVQHKFLDAEGKSDLLIAGAVDFAAKEEKEVKRQIVKRTEIIKKVPIEFAPPCIHNILNGLEDGRKRALFILINYFSTLKWNWEEIEAKLVEWNVKNKSPLSDNYIRMQIRWHKNREKTILPPNCKHAGWYMDFGVCKPDVTCGWQKKTIKNPVNYSIKKLGLNKSKRKYGYKLRRNTKNS